MANNYAETSDCKVHVSGVNWSTTYDTALNALVEIASREIDRFTKREPGYFYPSTDDATRYFDGNGERMLPIDDFLTITTVAVAETGDIDGDSSSDTGTYTTWATSDYNFLPLNASAKGIPYNALLIDQLNGSKSEWYAFPKAVKITGRFGGYSTPPPEIKQATILQAVRWFKRGQQGFQDTGAVTELRQLVYTKGLDPQVEALIFQGAGLRKVSI